MKFFSWPAGQQKREIYRFEIDDYISSSIIVLYFYILYFLCIILDINITFSSSTDWFFRFFQRRRLWYKKSNCWDTASSSRSSISWDFFPYSLLTLFNCDVCILYTRLFFLVLGYSLFVCQRLYIYYTRGTHTVFMYIPYWSAGLVDLL